MTMKMPKPTEEVKDLFRSLLPEAPGVTQRPMFGQLAGFVNGNMFLCLFGDRIALKVSEDDAAGLLRIKGAEPFVPIEGRPMRGYFVIPEAWHQQPKKAEEWVARSLAFVGSLPPKEAKPKKPKK
jgi:TfoX/Sxy family transcriptional regulator of competence genes